MGKRISKITYSSSPGSERSIVFGSYLKKKTFIYLESTKVITPKSLVLQKLESRFSYWNGSTCNYLLIQNLALSSINRICKLQNSYYICFLYKAGMVVRIGWLPKMRKVVHNLQQPIDKDQGSRHIGFTLNTRELFTI